VLVVNCGSSSVKYRVLDPTSGTRVAGGTIERFREIRGRFGVPGAAFDGSTTGLSADGRRLVLAEMTKTYPARRTHLLVLDTRRLRVLERLTLPGSFTVDAISPTGRWMYLIHYTSARDLLRYEVRAYDLEAGKLLARPVVDPREPDEKMLGTPVTRVTSADGRWAYTLYIRPDEAPFVHALDTARRTAACIDLPSVSDADSAALRLSLTHGGGTLRVDGSAGPEAQIDTRTFKVTDPAAIRPHPARRSPPPSDDGGGVPAWLTVVVAAAVLAARPFSRLAVDTAVFGPPVAARTSTLEGR
jgi:hypothetical protein